MKQKRRTTEEIMRILRAADGGKDLDAVCRKHNVSATSFYRWKKKFGGMELKDARKYRQLEKENGELKQMLAASLLQDPGAGGSKRKKRVSFSQKRRAIQGVVKAGLCSEQRACRYLGVHRSSHRPTPKQPSDWLLGLHRQIERLSNQVPTPGLPHADPPAAPRRLVRLDASSSNASGGTVDCGSSGGCSGPGDEAGPPAPSRPGHRRVNHV